MKLYGITLEERDELVRRQLGLCAIWRLARAEHVDHDHRTGRVRGVLCFSCNVGIGHLKDNPNLLRAAINYLET